MAATFRDSRRVNGRVVRGHEKRSGCIWAAEIDYLVSRATKGDPCTTYEDRAHGIIPFANLQRDKATILGRSLQTRPL